MKTLIIAMISITGIGVGLAALMIYGNISPAMVPSSEWKSFASFDIPGLNSTYQVGDTARFFVVKNGYGDIPCITPKITLYREEEPNILLVNYTNTTISCPVNMTGNYSMYFPSKTDPFVVSFEKPGSYVLNMSFTNDKSFQTTFPVTLSKQTAIYDSAFHDYPNVTGYSIVNATFGIPVENDSMATKMVGFDVSSPAYLPPGYQVKLIKVAKDLPLVSIFASKYPITNNTTNVEFFYNDTGILITYQIASKQALENQQWMWDSAPISKKTTIGGFHATFDDIQKLDHNGYLYDQWADLSLFKDNIIIGVRGFLAHDDLVKITASMLENKTESIEQFPDRGTIPEKITSLEDSGVITLKNQTYYYATPNYTNDAYTNSIQVSYHNVLFTLFPPGFRGGLPVGGCSGQYYWVDVKFADHTDESLHVLGDSQPCAGLIPMMLSNHVDPQAGLAFYDGKLRLLVREGPTIGKDIVLQKPSSDVKPFPRCNPNPAMEKAIREKQQVLTDALLAEEKKYGGFENRTQNLPWSAIGYDCVDNALEVGILPQFFNSDSLSKYFEKIRSIVGNTIDVVLSPEEYATPV